MKSVISLLMALCISFFFSFRVVEAKAYQYWVRDVPTTENMKATTPQELCRYYFRTEGANYLGAGNTSYDGSLDIYANPQDFRCTMYANPYYYYQHEIQFAYLKLFTGDCPDDTSLEFSTGSCKANSQKGVSEESRLCSISNNPSSVRGDPINAANGNNYQVELDAVVGVRHPIVMKRYYNSSDGVWRHSYSDYLTFADSTVNVVRDDGKESIYTLSNGVYTSYTDSGILSATSSGWVYVSSDGQSYYFNLAGKLVQLTDDTGDIFSVAYNNDAIVVTNIDGLMVTMTEDGLHQLQTLTTPNAQFTYALNLTRIENVQKTMGGVTTTRQYVYQDNGYFKTLLTGIIDERGIQFATWTYDTSTSLRPTLTAEHADGAEKTTFVYGDTSTTVTNELGKQLVFQFQTIHGAKLITAIQGEPSANCPASNSSYTYNDQGQVLTKTDAKGFITTYTYNDRGLEISRTEASGTPQARTTTTEWDPTRFL
ncbi:DUF6531 domain-containing protein, partial [Pseudomonas sp. dw_358]|uniref:DUF6531 domain-containing protein n=1 Tax=Pseudomonas sp. dw_358 TaxID=2720083 RepID=UPI001BD3BCB9